jgi:hypothetical protein
MKFLQQSSRPHIRDFGHVCWASSGPTGVWRARPGGIDRSRDFADGKASTFLLFSLWPCIISFPFYLISLFRERVMRAGWRFDTSSAPTQAIFLLHAGLVGASRAFAIRELLIAAACDPWITGVTSRLVPTGHGTGHRGHPGGGRGRGGSLKSFKLLVTEPRVTRGRSDKEGEALESLTCWCVQKAFVVLIDMPSWLMYASPFALQTDFLCTRFFRVSIHFNAM